MQLALYLSNWQNGGLHYIVAFINMDINQQLICCGHYDVFNQTKVDKVMIFSKNIPPPNKK